MEPAPRYTRFRSLRTPPAPILHPTRSLALTFRMLSFDPIQGRFVAELLTQTAAAIADQAACTLLARHPDMAARYGAQGFGRWCDALRSRVFDLAAALGANSPQMFAEQVAWTRVAIHARKSTVEDLRASLLALSATIERELPEEDRALVEVYINAGLAAVDGVGTPSSPLQLDTLQGRLAANYLVALLEGDRRRASSLVLDPVRQGVLPAHEGYTAVLVPALREVGRLWHMNELTISEEHFATNTTRHVMSQLAAFLPQKPARNRAAVVCAVQGNTHDIGARVIADFLEADGWRVIDLGADVPVEDIAASIDIFNADLVAISAMLGIHIRAAELAIQAVREQHPNVPVIVGGSAFRGPESLWRDINASGTAHTPESAVALANSLIQTR